MAGTASTLLTLWIQVKYFGVPFRGTPKEVIILTTLFSIAIASYGVLVRLIITQELFSIQVSAVTVLPTSVLGGYTFPLLAMPKFFQDLSAILPFVHYADPMRRLFLVGIEMKYIVPEIIWFVKFTLSMWLFSLAIFYMKKRIKKVITNTKDNKNKSPNTGEVVKA